MDRVVGMLWMWCVVVCLIDVFEDDMCLRIVVFKFV